MFPRIITLVLVLCFAFACSSKRPSGNTEAEILYKEATKLMEDKRYLLAQEKLNTVKSKYPYSYYATPAELMQADILFKQESYIEAAAAYQLFMEFHPKHQEIHYVLWQLAESFFNQVPPTFDRDLSPAVDAIKYYRDLLQRFPDSQYAESAKEKIKKCERMLQDKEQYIADFYFRTDDYSSARFHYLDILTNFKDEDLREHSMFGVVDSSYLMKSYQECLDYYLSYKDQIKKENLINKMNRRFEQCTEKLAQEKSARKK